MDTIVPHRVVRVPKTEPKAVLTYGDIRIELDLTYLHHLVNQGGWCSKWGAYLAADGAMANAMERIEMAMWCEAFPPKRAEE